MQMQIQKRNEQQPPIHFRLREGNYRVLMTYDTVEIISFEHFKNLASSLADPKAVFVTINDRIRNKSTILDVSPTTEMTTAQKEERLKLRTQLDQLYEESARLCESEISEFTSECLNAKYGENNWKRYRIPSDEIYQIRDQYFEENPEHQKKRQDIKQKIQEIEAVLLDSV